MYCPNCGTDCGEFKFCPNCGMKLPGQAQPPVQPVRERPPALFPWEIPFGRLEIYYGYMEMGTTEVIFHRKLPMRGEFHIRIPYNRITKVVYQPAEYFGHDHLTVRWVGNQYLPLPTRYFSSDLTTGCFKDGDLNMAYCIYCALKTAELRNYMYIKNVNFAAKRAELNAAGAFYCPACLSVDISTRRWGYNWGLGLGGAIRYPMFGAWLGTIGMRNQKHRCNNCGHLWNTFR